MMTTLRALFRNRGRWRRGRLRGLPAVGLALILAACASGPPAPVTDLSLGPGDGRATTIRTLPSPGSTYGIPYRPIPPSPHYSPVPGYHTVSRGETLYSIAWEAGLDYRTVAAWNDIPPPYTIWPGQNLRLTPTPGDSWRPRPVTPSWREPGYREPIYREELPPRREEPISPAPRPWDTTPYDDEPRPWGGPVESRPTSRGGVAWDWPARGRVINTFRQGDLKSGLDIGGQRGDPVLAAADGRVVYQGSSIRGYGQLIIIKHNEEYLSAYAHNDRILVREGAQVRVGQRIAEMGNSSADRVMLHFEIRYNGTVVDPMKYLPRR